MTENTPRAIRDVLGHMTCFGQWHMWGSDSRQLQVKALCGIALCPLAPLVRLYLPGRAPPVGSLVPEQGHSEQP